MYLQDWFTLEWSLNLGCNETQETLQPDIDTANQMLCWKMLGCKAQEGAMETDCQLYEFEMHYGIGADETSRW